MKFHTTKNSLAIKEDIKFHGEHLQQQKISDAFKLIVDFLKLFATKRFFTNRVAFALLTVLRTAVGVWCSGPQVFQKKQFSSIFFPVFLYIIIEFNCLVYSRGRLVFRATSFPKEAVFWYPSPEFLYIIYRKPFPDI